MITPVTVVRYLNERGRRHHWSIRAVKWLALISSMAMAVAASTSESDHNLRADGTKASPDEMPDGDVGGKPIDDGEKKRDAGEKSDPDSDSNELDESGAPSR